MKNKKAFTLIELIVVVAIVGVLVAMLAPMASGQIDNAKKTAAKANARTFYSASQSAVATMAAGWETKGSIIPSGMLDITDIYYESGLYRVYFGRDIANKGGLVEPVGTPIDTTKGWVSADETNTNTIASPYLNDIKEINKHMALYIGKDNKLVLDKGGYKFVGTGGGTTPPAPLPIVDDNADPANVTSKITTTGKNGTGTFAGREYRLAVSGLTPQAKYQVTIGGTSVGEFIYTDTMAPIDLKGEFTPTTDVAATHTAQVKVVALNPGANFAAEKALLTHDLTFYDGDGSTAKPYLICDPESLQMLSHKVKIDNANFGGKNYKQIATIDMTPVANFTPIGLNPNVFKGTYDGGAELDGTGHEIINLKINLRNASFVGLFGRIEGATLKNIGIGGSIMGREFVGGIVGLADINSSIINVYNKASVFAEDSSCGGIVGLAIGTSITNAYNTGEVSIPSTTGSGAVGGIVGDCRRSSVTNVYNTGSVTVVRTAHTGIGGIVGRNSGSITNAYNTGTISLLRSNNVGGIVGETVGGTILNVYNTGNVTGVAGVGGVVGHVDTTPTPTVTNAKYKKGITITVHGGGNPTANAFNVEYTNISEFFANTGANSASWNDKGQLLTTDGKVMGGPNPGDQ